MPDFKISLILVLTPLITQLVFRLLGKFKALDPKEKVVLIQPLDEKQFKKLNPYYSLIIISSLVIGTGIVFLILKQISAWYYDLVFPHEYDLRLDSWINLLPAFVLGAFLTGYPCERFMKWIFGNSTYEQYIYTDNLRRGANLDPLGKYMIKYGTIICILVFIYFLWCTSYIEGNSIVINDFGRMTSQVYRFNDISKILHQKEVRDTNGKINQHREYRVYFSDGFVWNVDQMRTNYAQFMEVLSRQSGVPIEDSEDTL